MILIVIENPSIKNDVQSNTSIICLNLCFSYKELSELVEATSEQLVDYQMSLIATTILHDAPSQNWTSQKPFYEGTFIFSN